jgi:hypothetical protein
MTPMMSLGMRFLVFTNLTVILMSVIVVFFAWGSQAQYIPVNCTAANALGPACMDLLRNYQYLQVKSLQYDVIQEPVIATADSTGYPIYVYAYMTYNGITDIDQVAGTITLSVFIDLVWNDPTLRWNPIDCPVQSIYIESDSVWVPDYILYNSVGSFQNNMVDSPVIWKSDGSMWWSRPGLITYSCVFDFRKFPFDKQDCTATFGSFEKSTRTLDAYFITNYTLTDDDATYSYFFADDSIPATIVDGGFKSSEFDVTGISSTRTIVIDYGVPYSLLNWTLHLSRYPTYYIYAAIIPQSLTTFFAICALWVKAKPTRIALSVTVLLTQIATQWTISSKLPITHFVTWLNRFSVGCIVIITAICLESCMADYMESKKGKVPAWVKWLIVISKPRYLIKLIHLWLKPQASRERASDMTLEMYRIEHTVGDGKPSPTAASLDEEKGDHDPAAVSSPMVGQDHGVASASTIVAKEVIYESNADHHMSWIAGGHALDRISRFIFILSFIVLIVVSIALSQTSAS